MLIGLTGRHLLDNNPAPEWLEHTPRGTKLRCPDKTVPFTNLTQRQCLEVADAVGDDWIANRQVALCQLKQYISKFSGNKRDRLVRSINDTAVRGSLDFAVKGFVKCDKYDPETVESKAPRMIQYRAPGTNAELAKFMEPIEHELLLGPGLGPTKLPECSKGMTLPRRAEVWAEKRAAIPDPICLMGDFSKFDAHVHTHALAMEHRVWRKMSGLPLKMLDLQLVNRGRAGPWKYTAVGTRMSGDRNTGGGNSIINTLITRAVARIAGITIEFLCDGDDSMVWLSRNDVDHFIRVSNSVVPRVFGMKWECSTTNILADEEYCHAALAYRSDGTPHCIVDPQRHLQRMCWTVNRSGRAQCGAIFVGNLVSTYLMYPNAPVLSICCFNILESIGAVGRHAGQAYVSKAFEVGEDNQWRKEFTLSHLQPHQRLLGTRVTTFLPLSYQQISEDARAQVAHSFGVSPEAQVHLERTFHVGFMNPILRLKTAKPKQLDPVELLIQCDTSTMVFS
jgi:hypothetical protein